jgi:hypothetical protein
MNTKIKVIECREIETNLGRGRGSKRVGRAGVRVRVVTDDEGESFFAIVNRTAAGALADAGTVSQNFDDAAAALDWGMVTARTVAGRP